jgi:hypothetical protein
MQNKTTRKSKCGKYIFLLIMVDRKTTRDSNVLILASKKLNYVLKEACFLIDKNLLFW